MPCPPLPRQFCKASWKEEFAPLSLYCPHKSFLKNKMQILKIRNIVQKTVKFIRKLLKELYLFFFSKPKPSGPLDPTFPPLEYISPPGPVELFV